MIGPSGMPVCGSTGKAIITILGKKKYERAKPKTSTERWVIMAETIRSRETSFSSRSCSLSRTTGRAAVSSGLDCAGAEAFDLAAPVGSADSPPRRSTMSTCVRRTMRSPCQPKQPSSSECGS